MKELSIGDWVASGREALRDSYSDRERDDAPPDSALTPDYPIQPQVPQVETK